MVFVLSVVGDVPVDSGAPVVTLSIICRLSLLEVLIGVGLRACIHRDECACVFVSVCFCTVFLNKLNNPNSIQTLKEGRQKKNYRRNFASLLLGIDSRDSIC